MYKILRCSADLNKTKIYKPLQITKYKNKVHYLHFYYILRLNFKATEKFMN